MCFHEMLISSSVIFHSHCKSHLIVFHLWCRCAISVLARRDDYFLMFPDRLLKSYLLKREPWRVTETCSSPEYAMSWLLFKWKTVSLSIIQSIAHKLCKCTQTRVHNWERYLHLESGSPLSVVCMMLRSWVSIFSGGWVGRCTLLYSENWSCAKLFRVSIGSPYLARLHRPWISQRLRTWSSSKKGPHTSGYACGTHKYVFPLKINLFLLWLLQSPLHLFLYG